MSSEKIIQQLAAATTSEQKAAIVAETIIDDLPQNLERVARLCGFLPWFNDNILSELLTSESDSVSIETIINLPFVENLSSGYCFHESTRRGLLEKYKVEKPDEIISAFETAEKAYQHISSDFPQALFWILYGYVITNQGKKAEEFFVRVLESGELKSLAIFSELDEAEEMCISEGVGLTPMYWLNKSHLFI